MWLLVMIFLLPTPGFASVQVLNKFATLEACLRERDRIGFEMAEAYPHDREFLIVCRPKESEV